MENNEIDAVVTVTARLSIDSEKSEENCGQEKLKMAEQEIPRQKSPFTSPDHVSIK